MSSLTRRLTVLALGSACALAAPLISLAATPTFTAVETQPTVTTGTNDQTDVTTPTQANVLETKASRTITVAIAPTNTQTLTIGGCVVTFATTTAGSPSQDLNCSDNAALITTATTSNDIAKTPTEIANALLSLTGVGSHGGLSVTASSTSMTSAVFTTTGTENSATTIAFSGTATASNIVSSNSVTGVIPVAQINTVTIGGTPEVGDTYTVTLPTVGAVSYTTLSSDTTTSKIADGLRTAIVASSGYGSQAFTAATSTNTVVFTAKVAGTGFTQTSSATNRAPIAQVVQYTAANTDGAYVYYLSLNGTTYTSQGGDTATVLHDLADLLQANTVATCTNNGSSITCTSLTPGAAALTFGASFGAGVPASTGFRSGGGGGGGGSAHTTTSTTASTSGSDHASTIADLMAQIQALKAGMTTTTAVSISFARNLTLGAVGDDVKALQVWLNTHGYVIAKSGAGSPGNESTRFGALTKAAVMKLQAANGIHPASGFFGPLTRALIP